MGGRNLIQQRLNSIKADFRKKSNFLDSLSRFDALVLRLVRVSRNSRASKSTYSEKKAALLVLIEALIIDQSSSNSSYMKGNYNPKSDIIKLNIFCGII